ncbi:ferredoxin [bacterium]|nr:ferredoxin [bacterium]
MFGFGVVEVVEEKEIDFSDLKLKKVWIEPGCIVCNACEEICPEVFEVLEDNCIVVDDADLELVKDILDAADACPVEVIKWEAA